MSLSSFVHFEIFYYIGNDFTRNNVQNLSDPGLGLKVHSKKRKIK